MKNHEIAVILREIGMRLEIDDVPFKPRAYEKAADALDGMDEDVAIVFRKGGVRALEAIPGVGESIAEKIKDYLTKGRVAEYERLKRRLPVDFTALTSVEGVGPKMVRELYRRLRVKTLTNLERACRKHLVQKLPGFGIKKEENILRGLSFLHEHTGRFLLGSVLPTARTIAKHLESHPAVERFTVGGSLRRRQETVGDIDIVLQSKKPEQVMDSIVHLPDIEHVYGRGHTKTSVRLRLGIDVDVRIVPERSFGAAEQYFTGDKAHNIKLRERAIAKGLTLNEYGLFRGKRYVAGRTEQEVYKRLGLQWMPPELRADRGEIEAAARRNTPKLLAYDDLRGDLQVQTNWTDGADSLEAMAFAAQKAGLSYIAITDHTKSLAMTHGSDEKQLMRQWKAIDRVNRSRRGARLLKGAEVNILRDGRLDISESVLGRLDVVGIAVHGLFRQPRQEMTKRVLRAMRHTSADILFHPTGRRLLQREASALDVDAVIREARKTHTVLEVNAQPSRLDLHDEYVRKAVDLRVKLAVNSDAHAKEHFQYLEYGIGQARRGWAGRTDVVNTLPLAPLLAYIRACRKKRATAH